MTNIQSTFLTNALGQPQGDARSAQTVAASQEFEAVFLSQFVDEMMKTAGASAFGDEHQAEMWRSFMSEAVAKHLVEQGGVGLSGSVSQMIGAYTSAPNDTQSSLNAETDHDPTQEIPLR